LVLLLRCMPRLAGCHHCLRPAAVRTPHTSTRKVVCVSVSTGLDGGWGGGGAWELVGTSTQQKPNLALIPSEHMLPPVAVLICLVGQPCVATAQQLYHADASAGGLHSRVLLT
jgi:hypothetical protein